MKLAIMIDSGAFSAWTRKEELDLDAYIEYAHTTINDNPDVEFVFVNLDVIGDGKASFFNWKKMIDSGIEALPIYHAGSDIKWLKRYLKHTDHIGLGAIANMSTSKRVLALDLIWEKYLIDEKRMPIAKVHGMGITSFPLMQRYPWHSLDSTSYLLMGAYGNLYVPKKKNGKWDFSQAPYILAFSERHSKIKKKNHHFTTLSPNAQKSLREYIEFTGYPYGKSGPPDEKGKPTVIEAGIINDCDMRCTANAFFFAQFAQNLPWPRPFEVRRMKGLLDG